MKKILLVCIQGMSAQLIAQKLQEELPNIEIIPMGLKQLEVNEEISQILLAPQIRYCEKELKEAYPHIPMQVISMDHYASMNVKGMIEECRIGYAHENHIHKSK